MARRGQKKGGEKIDRAPAHPNPSTPPGQIKSTPSIPNMDKRRRVDLSFGELLQAQRAETDDSYEAWRRAIAQYHQQHGEHEAAATVATIQAEIPLPLPESVLTKMAPGPDGLPTITENQPAINAAGLNHILSQCKPDDPKAQEIMKKNTARLVECGLVDKLGPQEPGSSQTSAKTPPRRSSSSRRTASSWRTAATRSTQSTQSTLSTLSETPSEPTSERVIDFSRVQAAHRRYWAAMGGGPPDL